MHAWMSIDFILFEAKDQVDKYCWIGPCSERQITMLKIMIQWLKTWKETIYKI
jgi:hypothetical protein